MKPSTALLVIDVQVGAFDAKLIPAIDGAARSADWHVIFVPHCALEPPRVPGAFTELECSIGLEYLSSSLSR
jgi:nicotinamidase-related amidase